MNKVKLVEVLNGWLVKQEGEPDVVYMTPNIMESYEDVDNLDAADIRRVTVKRYKEDK